MLIERFQRFELESADAKGDSCMNHLPIIIEPPRDTVFRPPLYAMAARSSLRQHLNSDQGFHCNGNECKRSKKLIKLQACPLTHRNLRPSSSMGLHCNESDRNLIFPSPAGTKVLSN